MKKKSAVERYKDMDEESSLAGWNDDFGLMILDAFEKAVNDGELNKTVKDLIDELEIRFNSS
jgi:hypothetical protein